MKYRYRLWCGDCRDIDSQGCFDGGTELSEETFDTYGEAENAGSDMAGPCSLWEYCVTDEEGHEIKETEVTP